MTHGAPAAAEGLSAATPLLHDLTRVPGITYLPNVCFSRSITSGEVFCLKLLQLIPAPAAVQSSAVQCKAALCFGSSAPMHRLSVTWPIQPADSPPLLVVITASS